jgi:hypothetical protein
VEIPQKKESGTPNMRKDVYGNTPKYMMYINEKQHFIVKSGGLVC